MCEHKEHEIATCETLLEAVKNGKCSSHEGFSRALWTLHGGMAVVIVLALFMLRSLIGIHGGVEAQAKEMAEVKTSQAVLQLTMNVHMDEDAHPVMDQRYNQLIGDWQDHLRKPTHAPEESLDAIHNRMHERNLIVGDQ